MASVSRAAVASGKPVEQASAGVVAEPVHDVSRLDGVTFLFGAPIAHSLAPYLHNTVFSHLSLNWSYILHESRSIPSFLALTKSPKFVGAAVTMPHKVAIIPHLHSLTPEAAQIGAVNTVFLKPAPDGQLTLCGTNTDCVGIREAIVRNIPPSMQSPLFSRNKPGLVIGGGGACRSAVYALSKWLGATPIYVVNRDKSEVDAVIAECRKQGYGMDLVHVETAEQAATLVPPLVAVSCIPDFPPVTPEELAARGAFEELLRIPGGVILEMCYHPHPWTAIAEISSTSEWQVVLGTEAMIWQGLEQDRIWTGRGLEEQPVEEVKTLIAGLLEKHSAH